MIVRRRRQVPTGLPVLSKGRHRRATHGACLMEYVSVLAGERWSDHPRCVDPPLAALARCVNDAVSDATRQDLAVWAPSFIGTAEVDSAARLAATREALMWALRRTRDDDERFLLWVALQGVHRAAGADGFDPIAWPLASEAIRARAARFVAQHPSPSRDYVTVGLPQAMARAVTVISSRSARNTDEILVSLLGKTLATYHQACAAGAAVGEGVSLPSSLEPPPVKVVVDSGA